MWVFIHTWMNNIFLRHVLLSLCFCNYCNQPYELSSQGRLVSCKNLSQRLESISDFLFVVTIGKNFWNCLRTKRSEGVHVGHGFDGVYLFCLLQHYLNDKTVFWTNSYLGLFSTSFTPLQELEADRLWGEPYALFLLMNFMLFLKDTRERRTKRTENRMP